MTESQDQSPVNDLIRPLKYRGLYVLRVTEGQEEDTSANKACQF